MTRLEPVRTRLATRVTLATVAVAVLATLITGVVSLGLLRGAAEDQARATLAKQAEVAQATLDQAPSARPARLRQLLRQQGIVADVVGPGLARPAYLTPADLRTLEAGGSVSQVRQRLGSQVFVEGRPLDGGKAVVLAQSSSAAASVASAARGRLILPLLAGLVGAALAGWLLARRLSRPIQQAAAAAHRLAAGSRDVALTPQGPQEVAELAGALNQLNSALATSEGREREFLLSVSHELRTPLTAVRGYAEALADGVVAPEDVARTGSIMLGQAAQLERLVADLLDLARLRAQTFRLDLADVDLAELVRQAGAVWQMRCESEGVELRVETPPIALVVRSDAARVRQIIDGLAENALRVTPAGAPIVLAAASVPATGAVLIEVRDGGPGLTDDDLTVAFQRAALYERYRGVRKVGTGFGLALVHALAARLGGTATAGRAPEGGARFSVQLPLGR